MKTRYFFTMVLMLTRYWVGAGKAAPKLAKISPKTGTTLTKRKIVIRMATTETTIGYIMEDLTCLPTFSAMETTSMLRLSRAEMAACSVAASTELRISRPEAVSLAT